MANTIKAGEQERSGLPRHIAIILDGNGRWAKKRGLPRTAGHAVGAETFRKIATYCKNIGVEYLTVYAFSTENWKRPPEEVKTIMKLLKNYLQEAIDTMEKDKIKMKVLGDVDELSDTERSMIAIHNGGIMGRGAGQSAVRVEMTHPESDYAFAFFVEEYGLGLSIILIALYVWIFFRAIEIFERCPKKFPAMLSLGVALLITMQALLHLMVTVNIIPETGQTLPLISRGGSSMLFTSIGLGIILSVSRQNAEGSYGDEQ